MSANLGHLGAAFGVKAEMAFNDFCPPLFSAAPILRIQIIAVVIAGDHAGVGLGRCWRVIERPIPPHQPRQRRAGLALSRNVSRNSLLALQGFNAKLFDHLKADGLFVVFGQRVVKGEMAGRTMKHEPAQFHTLKDVLMLGAGF